MTGQRVTFYLIIIGFLLLLIMVVLAVVAREQSEKERLSFSEEMVSSEAEGEVASQVLDATLDKAPEVLTESEVTRPKFTAILKAPADGSSSLERGADLFVSNGAVTAGVDSLRREVVGVRETTSVSASSSVVEVILNSFDLYDTSIDVSVVGLQSVDYELSVFVTDASGAQHEHLYASSTAELMLDTYSFGMESDAVAVSRRDFGQDQFDFIKSAGESELCDSELLTKQLTDLLTDSGWDMDQVPLIDTRAGVVSTVSVASLPFGTERVCAVQMSFQSTFTDMNEGMGKRQNFVGLVPHDSKEVIIAGEAFRQSPADGPLGSSNVIPLVAKDKGVQLLHLREQTSLIPINFPIFSTCPCTHQYQAVLTAPMSP